MADIRADKDAARESRDDSDPKKGLVDTSFAAGFETKAFEALERDFQEVSHSDCFTKALRSGNSSMLLECAVNDESLQRRKVGAMLEI